MKLKKGGLNRWVRIGERFTHLMSINGWLMVRAQKKKIGNIHGAQEPKGLQKMQKMNSAHEGISQPCEISQVVKFHKPGKISHCTKKPLPSATPAKQRKPNIIIMYKGKREKLQRKVSQN